MNMYEFQGTKYQTGNGLVEAGAISINDLPSSKLVELYNLINSNLGDDKRVKKFADKPTAIKRVTIKLEAYEAEVDDEVASPTPVAAKKPRKLRGMRFVFRPESEIVQCKGSIKSKSDDTRTLRQRAVDSLKKGATFEEIKAMVTKFDEDRGVETKNLERRSYELVRLVHYYLGYGLKQDGDTITAYT